jgi:cyclopropane-fatty-acyl-phospholipid synthase
MLGRLFDAIVRQGTLTLILPNGRQLVSGDGADPRIAIRLHDRKAVIRLALHPDLALGELYMDGRLTIEEGDIADLLALLMSNLARTPPSGLLNFVRAMRACKGQCRTPLRPFRQALRSVSRPGQTIFLRLFLRSPSETLEEAQIGKKRHIAAKLHLDRAGLSVLDIGSGWGGLALDLARDCGANVLGVTLSEEQLALARSARASLAGLSERCKFELVDYRALEGTFDRVVSVGMFEHVGVPYYRAFFDKLRALLNDDGVALIHTIGRSDGPGVHQSVDREIYFPGGYTPALSEMLPAIERRVDRDRCRSAAAPLCRDAQGMAPALQRRIGTRRPRSTTSGFAACGNFISPARKWLPARGPGRVPGAARQAHRCASPDPRLYARLGADHAIRGPRTYAARKPRRLIRRIAAGFRNSCGQELNCLAGACALA